MEKLRPDVFSEAVYISSCNNCSFIPECLHDLLSGDINRQKFLYQNRINICILSIIYVDLNGRFMIVVKNTNEN